MKRITLNSLDVLRIQSCIADARIAQTASIKELSALINELKTAEVLDPEKIPADVVTMNSIVTIRIDKMQKEQQIQLVYPKDANLSEGKISIFSPIATALIGYRAGDEIDWQIPSGITKIKIMSIAYQPEAAGHYNI